VSAFQPIQLQDASLQHRFQTNLIPAIAVQRGRRREDDGELFWCDAKSLLIKRDLGRFFVLQQYTGDHNGTPLHCLPGDLWGRSLGVVPSSKSEDGFITYYLPVRRNFNVGWIVNCNKFPIPAFY